MIWPSASAPTPKHTAETETSVTFGGLVLNVSKVRASDVAKFAKDPSYLSYKCISTVVNQIGNSYSVCCCKRAVVNLSPPIIP